MPSVILKNLPPSITGLSDQQLFDKLRSHNGNVGPVLPSTRSVYQRKLYALETGQAVEAHSEYPPADDDDLEPDDEQQVSKTSPVSQPRYRTTVTERVQATPGERRGDIGTAYARRPLHPGMGDYPGARTPNAGNRERAQAPVPGRPRISQSAWPLVFIISVVAIVVFLYLVFKNMEPAPVSSIPDEIDMQV
ncbi:hypothetical protein ACOMHN_039712 [Nucella lapillus]